MAFRRFVESTTADWPRRLPDTLDGVVEFLRGVARPLREEHVGSILFEEMRRSLGSVGAQRPPNSKIQSEGWLTCIQAELARIGGAGQKIDACAADWSRRLPKRMQEIHDDVFAEEFMQGRHLREMGGHELISKLVQALYALGATRLTIEDLEGDLIKALAEVYQENTLYGSDGRDDFVAPRDKLLAAGATVR